MDVSPPKEAISNLMATADEKMIKLPQDEGLKEKECENFLVSFTSL
jgi:hypothetical protein